MRFLFCKHGHSLEDGPPLSCGCLELLAARDRGIVEHVRTVFVARLGQWADEQVERIGSSRARNMRAMAARDAKALFTAAVGILRGITITIR